jgi:hypothetical protein
LNYACFQFEYRCAVISDNRVLKSDRIRRDAAHQLFTVLCT